MSFYVPPSWGSVPLGTAVKIMHTPGANAAMISAFFGAGGLQSLDGGARGRTFMIEGLATAAFPSGCDAFAAQLEGLADGRGRTLVDTVGNQWQQVVYRREFAWSGTYMPLISGGFCRPFRMVLHGLI